MAILAVGTIQGLFAWPADSRVPSGYYAAEISYAGVLPTNGITGDTVALSIPPQSTKAQVKTAVVDAIKADLTANYGYTFGPGDTVVVV